MTAEYRFVSTWCLDAPIEAVWDVIHDAAAYPRWWKEVTAVEILVPGDEHGVGRVARTTWRSALPYGFTFDFRVTEADPPYRVHGVASGELVGTGTWRMYEGRGTAVVYSWNVRTSRRWMNAIAPLARPAFAWNHDYVMRSGGRALAQRLGATLVAQS